MIKMSRGIEGAIESRGWAFAESFSTSSLWPLVQSLQNLKYGTTRFPRLLYGELDLAGFTYVICLAAITLSRLDFTSSSIHLNLLLLVLSPH